MGYRVVQANELDWVEREPEAGAVPRYVARLSDILGFEHTRSGMWRYPPGAKGRRHRDTLQEETFVVVRGTLTMYLGEPPERVDVPTGGLVHVDPGTPLQTVNHGDEDLLVYVHGWPPEPDRAELLESAAE